MLKLKILKLRTAEKLLNFAQGCFIIDQCIKKVQMKWANSVDSEEQSDLSLHCLPRPICPKIEDHYGIIYISRLMTKPTK